MSISIPTPTVGTAGSATGTATKWTTPARVVAVDLAYDSDAPVTTVVTVSNAGRDIVTVTGNTDTVVQPRVLAQGADGVNLADVWVEPVCRGAVVVNVESSDELDTAVIVRLLAS